MDSAPKPARSPASRAEQLAAECLRRCDLISQMTEKEGEITRRFLTPAIKQTHEYLRECMQETGLAVRLDDAGNLIGRRQGTNARKKLLIGSHLDTVPCGGKYDGLLGVLIGLAVMQMISDASLPMDIDLIGFSEEEGVRFSQPYLGSHAITGTFDPAWLQRVDDQGNTMRSVIESFGLQPDQISKSSYQTDDVIGFVETHIEQGPLLQQVDCAVAVVDSIAGQSRLRLRFTGRQGHAGTAPMDLRNDALVAAARWIVEVARVGRSVEGLRATVGYIDASPNIRNVIPDRVELLMDVRHFDDQVREVAVSELCQSGGEMAKSDGVDFEIIEQQTQPAVQMDAGLCELLRTSMESCSGESFSMFSGAGHDAAIVATKFPSTMLFIRQPSGISHHPDEDVTQADVAVAIEVLADFVARLGARMNDPDQANKDS